MTRPTRTDEALREAMAEVRRETSAAAAEVRLQLGAARRETGEALREAMGELRAALAEIWQPEATGVSTASEGGRLSRAQRKEMTRELLLDAAIDVFAEKGYNGASLDDVADAAGFTKGAVYSNFTRKSDLFRALLERETARYDAALVRTVEAVPLDLLPDVSAELLATPEASPETQTLMIEFWLAAIREPGLRGPLLAVADDVGAAIETSLRASSVEPGLRGHELAILFDALVTGLLMHRALDPEGDQPAILAKAMRKLITDIAPEDRGDIHRGEGKK